MSIATPLATSGRFIVDANGRRVRLAGVNWFGAHQDLGVPPGLDRVDRNALAETIAGLGFNSVRFPFSVWMTEQTAPVPDQYLSANPDLYGSTPMQVYDACVAALTGAGLIVIPNCHMLYPGWCCTDIDNNGLWYNDNWPAARFMAAWRDIAARYASNPLVAAMDIKNEPRSASIGGTVVRPSWGTGGGTDFAAMYAQTGDMIHAISPAPLIICEGLGYAADLTGVRDHPVRLGQPGKVVYSMHDYPWFHPPDQSPDAFADQVNAACGYLLTEGIAPVWLGEFSTDTGSLANFGLAPASMVGDARSGVWWTNIHAWLTANDVDWCWWGLNPTHAKGSTPVTNKLQYNWGDRASDGLLTEDWTGVANPTVMGILQEMMTAHTGPGAGTG
jgi:endoglucanase